MGLFQDGLSSAPDLSILVRSLRSLVQGTRERITDGGQAAPHEAEENLASAMHPTDPTEPPRTEADRHRTVYRGQQVMSDLMCISCA